MSFRPPRTPPVISVFHHPSSPPSLKAVNLLRRASTEPYPSPPSPPLRFELSVVERPPTSDQLKTMSRYYGRPISAFLGAHPSNPGTESSSGDEAERVHQIAQRNPQALKYPIVVDWDEGKIAVGDMKAVEDILEARLKARDGGSSGGGESGKKSENSGGFLGGLFGRK